MFVFNVSIDIIYKLLNVLYYNKGLFFLVELFWIFYFFNFNDDEIGIVYLFFKYKFYLIIVIIGEMYLFIMVYDDWVLEYWVLINKLIIY